LYRSLLMRCSRDARRSRAARFLRAQARPEPGARPRVLFHESSSTATVGLGEEVVQLEPVLVPQGQLRAPIAGQNPEPRRVGLPLARPSVHVSEHVAGDVGAQHPAGFVLDKQPPT
jgi:hypothetical protein